MMDGLLLQAEPLARGGDGGLALLGCWRCCRGGGGGGGSGGGRGCALTLALQLALLLLCHQLRTVVVLQLQAGGREAKHFWVRFAPLYLSHFFREHDR